ncbi:hypothetical protein ACFSVK_09505 [Azorhizophilus paspali]|uniref:hypothetical protein n=1 Tax=Azorhizophilus paspali TaxID=69963 RepID=UPI00364474BE
MVDRQHGVGLAAAESGLQLDDRIAALGGQALEHRIQQQTHALGDEGALEEQHRIEVLRRGAAVVYPREVGGELGLLEGPLEHVLVGNGDFCPRFENHNAILLLPTSSQP